MTDSPYTRAISRKRSWQPTQVTKGEISPLLLPTIRRVLALRHLELPVRELLQQGLDRELPTNFTGVREALESNQKDEERHDKALNYVVAAHGSDEKAEKVGLQLLDAVMSHPDHPILKAAILERSVFFVILPFLRYSGDIGIRTVAADISRDEQIHVAVHHMVATELKQRPSKSLNKLRRDVVAWAFEDLKDCPSGMTSQNFWLNASDNLYSRGVAPELSATRAARMPAFFEAANTDLPQYG